MDFGLTDPQRTIRDTARDLLDRRMPRGRVRDAAEAGRDDTALWDELVELGWPGIAVPEEYGGLGLGLVELCVLLEEQGAALAPTPLLPSTCAALVIARAGSAAQREAWLPALAEGRARGGIGAVRSVETPIVAGTQDPDVIVLADEDACWLLDRSSCSVAPVAAIDPLRQYMTVRGEGEPLPGDHARGLCEASVAVSAELVGVCRRALDITVKYVKERHQFGVPVGSFQAVSHRCAEMLLQTESARSTTYFAAWAADAEPERLAEAAALSKYVASKAAVEVASAAIQTHGGVGFTWEADIHWWYKRAQLSAQLLGGPAEQLARLGEIVASQARLA